MKTLLTRRELLKLSAAGVGGYFLGALTGRNASGSISDSRPTEEGGVTLVGAGDIANGSPGAMKTAALIDATPGAVMALGDLAYESGTKDEIEDYYEPTWGRFKDRTLPVVGNHDYGQGGYEDRDKSLYDPSPYFDYWGKVAGQRGDGWYSYDIGAWHLVVLNSMYPLLVGDSRQEDWLSSDLAVNKGRNIVALWHHPAFSSGYHGPDDRMKWAWEALYEYDASIIVNGHDHDYERFGRMTPGGDLDSQSGIRQFVVGTGGKNLRSSATPLSQSEAQYTDDFGVLKLILKPKSYAWEFVSVDGAVVLDEGTEET